MAKIELLGSPVLMWKSPLYSLEQGGAWAIISYLMLESSAKVVKANGSTRASGVGRKSRQSSSKQTEIESRAGGDEALFELGSLKWWRGEGVGVGRGVGEGMGGYHPRCGSATKRHYSKRISIRTNNSLVTYSAIEEMYISRRCKLSELLKSFVNDSWTS